MKKLFAILSLFVCMASAAADAPKPAVSTPDKVSKADKKAADKEFKNAIDLQKAGKAEDALLAVTKAAMLVPGNMEFITMREFLRQQLVDQHVEEGNRLAAAGDPFGALQRFHLAQMIDPQNAYVAQRMRDVTPPDPDPENKHALELLASVDQI